MKILLSLLSVALILSVGAVPDAVLREFASVSVAAPVECETVSTVTAGGTIFKQSQKEIYTDTPVIASHVSVSVGNHVKKGDRLAEIDTNLTKSVLANASIADYSGLAATDGLSALQSLLGSASSQNGDNALPDKNMIIPGEILAPCDGVITTCRLQEGVLTNNNEALITIEEEAGFYLAVNIGEADVSGVKAGSLLSFTSPAVPGKTYYARIEKVYPTATTKVTLSGTEVTVRADALVLKPDENLKSGYSVSCRVFSQGGRSLTVPYESILQDAGNTEYVLVAENGVAVRKDIVTGKELSDGVEVTDGITPYDAVVANADGIKEGQRLLIK